MSKTTSPSAVALAALTLCLSAPVSVYNKDDDLDAFLNALS